MRTVRTMNGSTCAQRPWSHGAVAVAAALALVHVLCVADGVSASTCAQRTDAEVSPSKCKACVGSVASDGDCAWNKVDGTCVLASGVPMKGGGRRDYIGYSSVKKEQTHYEVQKEACDKINKGSPEPCASGKFSADCATCVNVMGNREPGCVWNALKRECVAGAGQKGQEFAAALTACGAADSHAAVEVLFRAKTTKQPVKDEQWGQEGPSGTSGDITHVFVARSNALHIVVLRKTDSPKDSFLAPKKKWFDTCEQRGDMDSTQKQQWKQVFGPCFASNDELFKCVHSNAKLFDDAGFVYFEAADQLAVGNAELLQDLIKSRLVGVHWGAKDDRDFSVNALYQKLFAILCPELSQWSTDNPVPIDATSTFGAPPNAVQIDFNDQGLFPHFEGFYQLLNIMRRSGDTSRVQPIAVYVDEHVLATAHSGDKLQKEKLGKAWAYAGELEEVNEEKATFTYFNADTKVRATVDCSRGNKILVRHFKFAQLVPLLSGNLFYKSSDQALTGLSLWMRKHSDVTFTALHELQIPANKAVNFHQQRKPHEVRDWSLQAVRGLADSVKLVQTQVSILSGTSNVALDTPRALRLRRWDGPSKYDFSVEVPAFHVGAFFTGFVYNPLAVWFVARYHESRRAPKQMKNDQLWLFGERKFKPKTEFVVDFNALPKQQDGLLAEGLPLYDISDSLKPKVVGVVLAVRQKGESPKHVVLLPDGTLVDDSAFVKKGFSVVPTVGKCVRKHGQVILFDHVHAVMKEQDVLKQWQGGVEAQLVRAKYWYDLGKKSCEQLGLQKLAVWHAFREMDSGKLLASDSNELKFTSPLAYALYVLLVDARRLVYESLAHEMQALLVLDGAFKAQAKHFRVLDYKEGSKYKHDPSLNPEVVLKLGESLIEKPNQQPPQQTGAFVTPKPEKTPKVPVIEPFGVALEKKQSKNDHGVARAFMNKAHGQLLRRAMSDGKAWSFVPKCGTTQLAEFLAKLKDLKAQKEEKLNDFEDDEEVSQSKEVEEKPDGDGVLQSKLLDVVIQGLALDVHDLSGKTWNAYDQLVDLDIEYHADRNGDAWDLLTVVISALVDAADPEQPTLNDREVTVLFELALTAAIEAAADYNTMWRMQHFPKFVAPHHTDPKQLKSGASELYVQYVCGGLQQLHELVDDVGSNQHTRVLEQLSGTFLKSVRAAQKTEAEANTQLKLVKFRQLFHAFATRSTRAAPAPSTPSRFRPTPPPHARHYQPRHSHRETGAHRIRYGRRAPRTLQPVA